VSPKSNPWIRTPDQLHDLVDELAGCRAIGIDVEGDSLHHYAEKVCLVQLSAYQRGAWLVDPLALRDLSPLAPILADPAVLKVFHAGDNDITAMRRDFGVDFATVFDTAIAARLLGDTELSLQALVRNELGVELVKSSQRDDWSRRPLTPKQEAYALADVEHLMDLAARMTARLASAGRTEWAREEFAALAALPASEKRSGPDEFRRIKGSHKLSPRQQAVLRELYEWREDRAAEADLPPFRILAPDALLELATNPPTTLEAVRSALARHPRQLREADIVLGAIEYALDLPDAELPAPPPREGLHVAAGTRRRIDALKVWRDAEARRSQLDPAIVLPSRLVERVAAVAPQSIADLAAVEGIRQWRVGAWGPAMLAACAPARP
jgi:ribonuclease D